MYLDLLRLDFAQLLSRAMRPDVQSSMGKPRSRNAIVMILKFKGTSPVSIKSQITFRPFDSCLLMS